MADLLLKRPLVAGAALVCAFAAAAGGTQRPTRPADTTVPRAYAALVHAHGGSVPLTPGASDTDSDVPVAPQGPNRSVRAEPAVAVDARNPLRVTVGMNDYDPSNDPIATLYLSADGGRTFRGPVRWPLAGAVMSGDPSLAAGPDGSVYFSFSSYAAPGGPKGIGGLFVVRSKDGGRTWARNPVALARNDQMGSPAGCHFNDKSEITVDPRTGDVYVAWMDADYDGSTSCAGGVSPIYLARSTDRGAHFTRALVSTPFDYGSSPMPRVAPDGTVYVAYVKYVSLSCGPLNTGQEIDLGASSDHGRTFTTSIAIPPYCGPSSPSPTLGMYRTRSMPTMEITPGGAVVIAAPVPSAQHDVVTVVRSVDHGTTWRKSAGPSVQAYGEYQFPRLARGPHGKLALTYIEQLPAGVFSCMLSLSYDGGLTWSAPQTVSSEQSIGNEPHLVSTGVNHDVGTAYDGDYLGLAIGSDSVAHPAWTDLRGTALPAEENVWTRRMRI